MMDLYMTEDDDVAELTQKHFAFLVTEYGFLYDRGRNMFDHKNIRVYVEQIEDLTPSVILWLKTEPKFTYILIDWILEGNFNYSDMYGLSKEDRYIYYSNLFQRFAHKLVFELDKLLLPALKKRFISNIEAEGLTRTNYKQYLSSEISRQYHYLKKIDPKWDPEKELKR